MARRALVRYVDGEHWVALPNPQLARDVVDGRAAVLAVYDEDGNLVT